MATQMRDLLTRLDERTERTQKDVKELVGSFQSMQTEMRKDYVARSEFESLQSNSISREEFKPVQAVVYGMVGLFLTGAGVAIVAMIWK